MSKALSLKVPSDRSERELAQIGPLALKEKGSKEYAYQMIELLKFLYQSQKITQKKWNEVCDVCIKEKVPQVLGFEGIDALLLAELGKTKQELSPEVVSDRLTRFEDLKQAAVTFFGDIGGWAYDEWARLNDQYFNNDNKVGPFLWGLTPHGRSLGYYSSANNIIFLHQSLVEPSTEAPWGMEYLNKLVASDVLLHEMIHQKISQNGGWSSGTSSHNNKEWVAEVNCLAQLLGINVKASICKQKRVGKTRVWMPKDGCIDQNQLARFPMSCRPKDYYESVTWSNK